MKPDLANYPEIPLGCLINENKHFNLFQIYRNVKVTDANTGKSSYKRETVGSIKDGVFTFSKTYLLKQKNKHAWLLKHLQASLEFLISLQ